MRSFLQKVFYEPTARYFTPTNNFLAAITLLSVAGIVLETVQSLASYQPFFTAVEYFTVFFFSLEYIGRVLAHKNPLRYMISFFGIIDLLAIIPTYTGLTNLTFLKTARMVRILRFLRVLRLAKLTRAVKENKDAPSEEEEDLLHSYKLRIYVLTLFSSVIIFASLMYITEGTREAFSSIPQAMIWSAKIILGGIPQTVPVTIWGELITISARFTGLLLFGLLISIVGSGVQRLLFGKIHH
ncbi:MAG: ion transporter [Patescibacteria group bacterium UBA2163]